MGQAFRRASGRIRSTSLDPPSSSLGKKAVDSRPPVAPPEKFSRDNVGPGSEVEPRVNVENMLEEKDPQYDVMLSQMVGRIRSKPGGKLEMGEASVVERYKRPLPKLRNTTVESGRYEERAVPPGTLNVAQLRHIILLHQGKADDHDGPMGIHQIADKFRVDVVQIEKILQSVSLPPEDTGKKR
ncbi:Integrator complex subunit like [Actinidia chinensis var. chinensis]|uniref:Integrator complex subunit like n=1 Tax=Actinidia chinensis var. chinensis TaxID=1590841 RepID=A0A2R6PJY1_ACTCC|nr:Integrator complex subunit like [Actinidia chinensis var. chinensis]